MVAALILVNGVTGSNDAVDAGDLVTLTNLSDGGEVTFAWSFLSRPPGAADTLTGASTASATFTPTKEGTYLIRLIVNAALDTRRENRVVVAVRFERSGLRGMGLGESTEVLNNAADFMAHGTDAPGWRKSLADVVKLLDRTFGDTGRMIVYVNETVSLGSVVAIIGRANGTDEVATSPMRLTLYPTARAVNATVDLSDYMLGVVEDAVQANYATMSQYGPWAGGGYYLVRFFGQPEPIRVLMADAFAAAETGATPDAESVFVSDTGTVSRTPGTFSRRIGVLLSNEVAPYPNRYFIDGFARSVPAAMVSGAPWSTAVAPTEVQTTDATTTTLAAIQTTANKNHALDLMVSVGRDDQSAGVTFKITAHVSNEAGACTVRDQVVSASDGGASGWTAVLDVPATAIRVRVTGAGGTVLDWIVAGTMLVHGS